MILKRKLKFSSNSLQVVAMNDNHVKRASLIGTALVAAVIGIGAFQVAEQGVHHPKYGWDAEFYFRGQPNVIELCSAVNAGDLKRMETLIGSGADVSANGKNNMTLLLWAYTARNFEAFELLLKKGANPNVIFETDFGAKGRLPKIGSVTHLCTLDKDVRYFESVFENGGDPNLDIDTIEVKYVNLPIIELVKWGGKDKKERIKFLVDHGADVNKKETIGRGGFTAAMSAVGWFGQYELTMYLLNLGADFEIYQGYPDQIGGEGQLAHLVLKEARRPQTPEHKQEYADLVAWMKDNGADFEKAQADIDRWSSWQGGKKFYLMDLEANRNWAIEAKRLALKEAAKNGIEIDESKYDAEIAKHQQEYEKVLRYFEKGGTWQTFKATLDKNREDAKWQEEYLKQRQLESEQRSK